MQLWLNDPGNMDKLLAIKNGQQQVVKMMVMMMKDIMMVIIIVLRAIRFPQTIFLITNNSQDSLKRRHPGTGLDSSSDRSSPLDTQVAVEFFRRNIVLASS